MELYIFSEQIIRRDENLFFTYNIKMIVKSTKKYGINDDQNTRI